MLNPAPLTSDGKGEGGEQQGGQPFKTVLQTNIRKQHEVVVALAAAPVEKPAALAGGLPSGAAGAVAVAHLAAVVNEEDKPLPDRDVLLDALLGNDKKKEQHKPVKSADNEEETPGDLPNLAGPGAAQETADVLKAPSAHAATKPEAALAAQPVLPTQAAAAPQAAAGAVDKAVQVAAVPAAPAELVSVASSRPVIFAGVKRVGVQAADTAIPAAKLVADALDVNATETVEAVAAITVVAPQAVSAEAGASAANVQVAAAAQLAPRREGGLQPQAPATPAEGDAAQAGKDKGQQEAQRGNLTAQATPGTAEAKSQQGAEGRGDRPNFAQVQQSANAAAVPPATPLPPLDKAAFDQLLRQPPHPKDIEATTRASGAEHVGTRHAAELAPSSDAPVRLVSKNGQGGQQAAEQVSVKIRQSAGLGNDRILVRLEPADLGKVEVRIDVHDGKAHVVVSADSRDTLDQLQRDARSLERALADIGYEMGESGMEFQMGGEDGQAQSDAETFGKVIAEKHAEALVAGEGEMSAEAKLADLTVENAYRYAMTQGLDVEA